MFKNDPAPKTRTRDEDRCPANHNPGEWPYVAGCVLEPHDDHWHRDSKGRTWNDWPPASMVWSDNDEERVKYVRSIWPELAEALDAEVQRGRQAQ